MTSISSSFSGNCVLCGRGVEVGVDGSVLTCSARAAPPPASPWWVPLTGAWRRALFWLHGPAEPLAARRNGHQHVPSSADEPVSIPMSVLSGGGWPPPPLTLTLRSRVLPNPVQGHCTICLETRRLTQVVQWGANEVAVCRGCYAAAQRLGRLSGGQPMLVEDVQPFD